jgi:hypothetical protein
MLSKLRLRWSTLLSRVAVVGETQPRVLAEEPVGIVATLVVNLPVVAQALKLL